MYYDLSGMKTWMSWAAGMCALLMIPQPPTAMNRTMAKDARGSQVDAWFSGLVAAREPGAAVLVLKNGGVAFERGYGVTELRTLRRIDARTSFRLASFTKQFTAAAIMLLVRDGKLRYETRLGDIFPDFPAYGQPITIRQLLNHTSGLPDYEELMPPTDAGAPVETIQIRDRDVLELLKRQAAAKFAPGAQWAYSNSGYVVLGLVVEKISGRPFGRFLHDRIFAPLKMDRTLAYERGRNEVPDRAYGHSREPDGWRQTDQSPTSATLGDGGVYSSLADLAKWDGALRRHLLLSEAEMRPALTPVRVPAGPPVEADGTAAAYGFGWFLNPWEGHDRMWHTGETRGFRTAIERFPKDGLTVIVLSNRGDLDAGALALKIAGVYLERE
jgi:CubicO group peptidase (beta-lactamase class C family)